MESTRYSLFITKKPIVKKINRSSTTCGVVDWFGRKTLVRKVIHLELDRIIETYDLIHHLFIDRWLEGTKMGAPAQLTQWRSWMLPTWTVRANIPLPNS